MNRRELLQKTSMVLGYAVSAPTLAAILNGCKAKVDLNYTPVFFNEQQAALVSHVAEIIIPKTDTPGAKDVGVPAFIDALIAGAYSKADQQKFIDGLNGFDADAKKEYGSDFLDLSPEDQTAFVVKTNKDVLTSQGGAGSEGWWAAGSKVERPFILKMKELTLLGFFTSEPGATQVLQYNQSPGPYHGCVPLAQVGKAWAT